MKELKEVTIYIMCLLATLIFTLGAVVLVIEISKLSEIL